MYFQTSSALDQPLMENTVIKINVQRNSLDNEHTIYIQAETGTQGDQDAFSSFSDDPKYMG